MPMPFQFTQAYYIGLYSQMQAELLVNNYTSRFLKENISHWGKLQYMFELTDMVKSSVCQYCFLPESCDEVTVPRFTLSTL